ncbi:MAG: YciI family protein [Intrasporangium sp.]|uniref:YciI family protein n=1 Tax=Intrasporangium sp. TaxID=1925024 RepID=UPI00264746D2|nr:YciI family protein [Intrasporangium sp.]MDN5794798.1 YciI family protein [Intrasporangium sp.]
MADTYVYLIHEPDWDSDTFLPGNGPAGKDPRAHAESSFPQHKAFQAAVAELGARVVGGAALQNSKFGGTVRPGAGERRVEDAAWTDGPFTETSEVITGFYLVETDDPDLARRIAALVPTGGSIEWRKVFPPGM